MQSREPTNTEKRKITNRAFFPEVEMAIRDNTCINIFTNLPIKGKLEILKRTEIETEEMQLEY